MTDDREPDVDPLAALPPGEPETPTDRVIAKTPWWAMSTGLHVVATLVMAYLIVLSGPAEAEIPTNVRPTRRVRPFEIERPRDIDPNKKILDIKKPTADPVFNRQAEESERNETDDDEPWHLAKGDSLDLVSDKPFKGKGTYDTIGGGGGGGGRYGQRLGGDRNLATKRGGGDEKTEDAVLNALIWLARHQNPDGSWNVTGYVNRCAAGGKCLANPGADDFDAGVTGLSLLAFLGAGYSHLSRDVHEAICFGDVVKKGLQWLMNHQDPEGCIGPRAAHQYMYNHTIGALALSEAYGLTGSNLFRDQAQKAVDFTLAAQNPGKGWRYSFKCGDNDSSVTGWAVMVLKSAQLADLSVTRAAFDGARAWFDEVTDETYYRVGYTHKRTGPVKIPGKNENFNHHEALTAVAVMSRIFMQTPKGDPRLLGGCREIVKDLPSWKEADIDFYYWYYASLALFQFDGPKGMFWSRWNERMKDVLVKNQNTASSGCKKGSWEPVDRWSCEGGRVYATAINALTLEVYYRYANVFGVK